MIEQVKMQERCSDVFQVMLFHLLEEINKLFQKFLQRDTHSKVDKLEIILTIILLVESVNPMDRVG